MNLPICPSRRSPFGRGRRVKAPAPRSRGKSGRWGATQRSEQLLYCCCTTTVLSSPFLIPSLLLLLHPPVSGVSCSPRLALARVGAEAEAASLSPIECAPGSLAGRWLSRSGRVSPRRMPPDRRSCWPGRDRPRGQINGERNQRLPIVRQRQLEIMEDCLAATIPDSQYFVHSALLWGLASIT